MALLLEILLVGRVESLPAKGNITGWASAYRNFAPVDIMTMPKKKLTKLWLRFAFPLTDGKPYCPKCGSLRCTKIKTRKQYNCTDCGRRYSNTSGTIFAYRKLTIRKILFALAEFQDEEDALPANSLARKIGVSYKTAWVMAHKLRQLMEYCRRNDEITEDVAVDGAYFGGLYRRQNIRKGDKAQKLDRRLKRFRDDNRKKVVVVIKQRSSNTAMMAREFESEKAAVEWVRAKVPTNVTIYTDKGPWSDLGHTHEHEVIDHSYAFKLGDCDTNTAESFFSTLRVQSKLYRSISRNYFSDYINEQVWRRSARIYNSNFDRFTKLAEGINGFVPDMRGYWQHGGAA